MVEFPNDGRGRVNEGRWWARVEETAVRVEVEVEIEVEVEVEVAEAIESTKTSVEVPLEDAANYELFVCTQTAPPSLSAPDVFTHLGPSRGSRRFVGMIEPAAPIIRRGVCTSQGFLD